MKPRADRPKSITPRRALLALLILSATIAVALLARETQDRNERSASSPGADRFAAAGVTHTLPQVSQAGFISIFQKDEAGRLSSLMVSSGTEEFDALAGAMARAQSRAVEADESFDTLFVISFGRDDSLDVTYSPSLNIIMVGDQAYAPAADLTPLIEKVRANLGF